MVTGNSSQSPRILICRLSHIGDCLLTLPLLTALRQNLPDAYIAWAVEPPADQLLSRHPDLDELIRVPRGWMKRPREITRLRRELRNCKFDYTLDPQGLTKSAALARLSAAPRRFGFAGKRYGRELSRWLNNCLVPSQSPHLVDRSVDLLTGLHVRSDSIKFKLPINNAAMAKVHKFLVEHSLNETTNQRFVVVNPGASWPSKRWENERFAAVVTQLYAAFNVRSVVTWAGEQEYDDAVSIVNQAGDSAILAEPTNLQELAALLYQSCLYLGCDTGPTHLAAAVGTTCVGLYGPTRPQDSGAYGPQHFAIQNWYQAGGNRERRRAGNEAMRSISVEQVVHYCELAFSRMLPDVGSQAA